MKKKILAAWAGLALCAFPALAADGAAAITTLQHVDLGGTYYYGGTPMTYTNQQVLDNIQGLNDILEKDIGYKKTGLAAGVYMYDSRVKDSLDKLIDNQAWGAGTKWKAKIALSVLAGMSEKKLADLYGLESQQAVNNLLKKFMEAKTQEEVDQIGATQEEKDFIKALQVPRKARMMETTLMGALPKVAKTVDATIDQINVNTKAIGTLQTELGDIGKVKQGITALDSRLTSEVNRLDTRIDRVGALTGALAGLKPIQYDPEAPTQIMAAVATYEGKQGFALGIAHYSKENLLFHAGVAYDGDDKYMGNVGVTLKVGAGSSGAGRVSPSAVRVMQHEIDALRADNEAILAEIAALNASLN